MSLSVTIQLPASDIYTLRAERITHEFKRFVKQSALVGNSATKDPQVFLFDLGRCIETIIINGIINAGAIDSPLTPTSPSISQMKVAVRRWWTTTNVNTDMVYLVAFECTQGVTTYRFSYYGLITKFDVTQISGVEGYGKYELVFVVKTPNFEGVV